MKRYLPLPFSSSESYFKMKRCRKSRSYTLVSSVCNPALAGTNYTDKVDLNDGENISSVFTSSISGKK